MAFLVFEGIDGSGKSSLIESLSKELQTLGISPLLTREPGGTPLGEDIRELVLKKSDHCPTPKSEILLYEAIRAQHVEKKIKPALQENKWILCDRFTASSVAFQSAARNLNIEDIQWLNTFATDGLKPDLMILLDISIEESVNRQQNRFDSTGTKADRFESESKAFHQAVRDSYLLQVEQNPKAWLKIDANQSKEMVFKNCLMGLRERKWLDS